MSRAAIAFPRVGQPLLLAATFALWLTLGGHEVALGLAWLALVAVLAALENIVPYRPAEWPTLWKRAPLIVTGIALSFALGTLGAVYEETLRPLLAPIAAYGPGALWPAGLHWSLQALLLYLLADALNYWLHRAVHRCPLLWRISGHGVHHSFHGLNAHHGALTNPLELFFLAAPMALVSATFGIEGAVR